MVNSKELDSYSNDLILLASTLYADVMKEFNDCLSREIKADDVKINLFNLKLDGNSVEELVHNYLKCEEEMELLSTNN